MIKRETIESIKDDTQDLKDFIAKYSKDLDEDELVKTLGQFIDRLDHKLYELDHTCPHCGYIVHDLDCEHNDQYWHEDCLAEAEADWGDQEDHIEALKWEGRYV